MLAGTAGPDASDQSGFGTDGSTIAETTGLAKVYREHLEARIRKNSYVQQKSEESPSGERRNFMTALAIGEDYRAALTMFFSSPLSAQQITKERRRAEDAGLGFQVTDSSLTRARHRGLRHHLR